MSGRRLITIYFIVTYFLPMLGNMLFREHIDSIYKIYPLTAGALFVGCASYLLYLFFEKKSLPILSFPSLLNISNKIESFYIKVRLPFAIISNFVAILSFSHNITSYRYHPKSITQEHSLLLILTIIFQMIIMLDLFYRMFCKEFKKIDKQEYFENILLGISLIILSGGIADLFLALNACLFCFCPNFFQQLIFPGNFQVVDKIKSSLLGFFIMTIFFIISYYFGSIIKSTYAHHGAVIELRSYDHQIAESFQGIKEVLPSPIAESFAGKKEVLMLLSITESFTGKKEIPRLCPIAESFQGKKEVLTPSPTAESFQGKKEVPTPSPTAESFQGKKEVLTAPTALIPSVNKPPQNAIVKSGSKQDYEVVFSTPPKVLVPANFVYSSSTTSPPAFQGFISQKMNKVERSFELGYQFVCYYLVERMSIYYYSFLYTQEVQPPLHDQLKSSPIWIPLKTAIFRLNYLLGDAFNVEKPKIGTINQLNYRLLLEKKELYNERAGSAPGLLGSFNYIFSFPFNIIFSAGYLWLISGLIDLLLVRRDKKPLSLVGLFVLLYYAQPLFASPFDFAVIFDFGSVMFLSLIYFYLLKSNQFHLIKATSFPSTKMADKESEITA